MSEEQEELGRYQRRTIDLHEDHWAVLDALAEDLGAYPQGGARRSHTSWRALLRLIAEGHYLLSPSVAARMETPISTEQTAWRVRWRKRTTNNTSSENQKID